MDPPTPEKNWIAILALCICVVIGFVHVAVQRRNSSNDEAEAAEQATQCTDRAERKRAWQQRVNEVARVEAEAAERERELQIAATESAAADASDDISAVVKVNAPPCAAALPAASACIEASAASAPATASTHASRVSVTKRNCADSVRDGTLTCTVKLLTETGAHLFRDVNHYDTPLTHSICLENALTTTVGEVRQEVSAVTHAEGKRLLKLYTRGMLLHDDGALVSSYLDLQTSGSCELFIVATHTFVSVVVTPERSANELMLPHPDGLATHAGQLGHVRQLHWPRRGDHAPVMPFLRSSVFTAFAAEQVRDHSLHINICRHYVLLRLRVYSTQLIISFSTAILLRAYVFICSDTWYLYYGMSRFRSSSRSGRVCKCVHRSFSFGSRCTLGIDSTHCACMLGTRCSSLPTDLRRCST